MWNQTQKNDDNEGGTNNMSKLNVKQTHDKTGVVWCKVIKYIFVY